MQQKIFVAGILSLAILGVGCSRSAENKVMKNEKATISPVASASPSPDRIVGNKNDGSSASAFNASPVNPMTGTPKSRDDNDHGEKKDDKDALKKRYKG